MNTLIRDEIKTTVLEIAGSKKWLGAIVSFLAIVSLKVAAKLHLGISPDEARELASQVVTLAMTAIGGQVALDVTNAIKGSPAPAGEAASPGAPPQDPARGQVPSTPIIKSSSTGQGTESLVGPGEARSADPAGGTKT